MATDGTAPPDAGAVDVEVPAALGTTQIEDAVEGRKGIFTQRQIKGLVGLALLGTILATLCYILVRDLSSSGAERANETSRLGNNITKTSLVTTSPYDEEAQICEVICEGDSRGIEDCSNDREAEGDCERLNNGYIPRFRIFLAIGFAESFGMDVWQIFHHATTPQEKPHAWLYSCTAVIINLTYILTQKDYWALLEIVGDIVALTYGQNQQQGGPQYQRGPPQQSWPPQQGGDIDPDKIHLLVWLAVSLAAGSAYGAAMERLTLSIAGVSAAGDVNELIAWVFWGLQVLVAFAVSFLLPPALGQ